MILEARFRMPTPAAGRRPESPGPRCDTRALAGRNSADAQHAADPAE